MAASLMSLTGRPKALLKLKPTQPDPRLCGSDTSLPCTTGPGYPIDTTSYFQSLVNRLTSDTMRRAVSVGPESNLRASCCPVARTFTWVPPTSIASTFIVPRFPTNGALGRASPAADAARMSSAGLPHDVALRSDDRQQLVPGFHERLGAFVLQPGGQGIDIDAGLGEFREHRLAVSAIGWE